MRAHITGSQGESARVSREEALVSGTVFVLLYLYLVLVIDTHLIYDGFWKLAAYPSFLAEWRFLRTFFTYPGGPIECASRFLSQCYYYAWLGALIVAAMTWGICRCFAALIALAGGRRARVMPYAPALLVLVMYNRWDNPLATCLALLAALLFSVVYETTPLRHHGGRAFLYIILSGLLYYVAGGASLVFAVVGGAHEALTQKRRLLGGFYVLFGLAVPWLVGAFGFNLLLKDSYLSSLPFHPKTEFLSNVTTWTARGLYLLVPLALLIVTSCNVLAQGRKESAHGTQKKGARAEPAGGEREAQRFPNARLRAAGQAIASVLVAVPTLFYSFDPIGLCFNKMTHFSRDERWSDVLELGRRLPRESYNQYWNHDIDRALYHTGRLAYDMFRYPQRPEGLLLFYSESAGLSYSQLSKIADMSLDLGDLNAA